MKNVIMLKAPLVSLVAVVALGWFLFINSNTPQQQRKDLTNQTPQAQKIQAPIVAQNLETPWAVAFLPNGDFLLTERPGKVKLVEKNGQVKQISELSQVKQIGEGGLLGITLLQPEFKINGYIYLYYTYSGSGSQTLNRVSRFTFKSNKLSDEQIIVDKIPGASNHNGGRIKFGPDGMLYIGTGDSQNPSLSQDKNSLAGKILRINSGKVEVYSYGHRNVQGLTWDDSGQLWATEHGSSAFDEVNRITEDKNYGWPEIRGDEQRNGMERPAIHSGGDTWAPSGAAFVDGSVFFAGLRGSALYEFNVNEQKLMEHFKNEYGRIRDVVLGPDGMLYVTTGNTDGRGIPKGNDDKIIRIDPKNL